MKSFQTLFSSKQDLLFINQIDAGKYFEKGYGYNKTHFFPIVLTITALFSLSFLILMFIIK
jgi:hypothetical protein